jgi:hypothetical protein
VTDIFQLFDGTMGAGAAASVSNQSAGSFSSVTTDNDLISTLASGSDAVSLLVDYSDFANFVTFNSAQSYVTVTADQVVNEYPMGGSANDLQVFINSLDGYQQYFLTNWPSWAGHLRLNPAVSASYVSISDNGVQDGVARTAMLSPGTGSITVQAWIDVPVLTGSSDVQVVFQKAAPGGTDGYTAFVSGSAVYFQVSSGSTLATVSGSLSLMPSFFSAVLDRGSATGSLSMYVGTSGTYPVRTDFTSVLLGSRFDLASGSFYIGSGSVVSKVVRPFTGSLDDVSAWFIPRACQDITGSYNRRTFAQYGLTGLWRFNDASPSTPSVIGGVIHDSSGNRLDGRVQMYFSGSRGSGSLTNDSVDPILSLDDPTVVSYVVNAQVTGALYDRNNQSLIFNLFPDAFSSVDPASQAVFESFTLILARHYDRLKLYITQLPNLRRVNYDEFDQAPDELLDQVGDFMGWNLQGSFVTTDALKYFLGRNVTLGPEGNAPLDTQLFDIKAQFWRRVLQNLVYLYKTKGTREGVEALMRAYGVDDNFVRLKEYSNRNEQQLVLNRVEAEKSVFALQVSGSVAVSAAALNSSLTSDRGDFSIEARVRFPLPDDDLMPPTQLSGVIASLSSGSSAVSVWYSKPLATSLTGNIYVSSSAGVLQLTSASVFDDNFYNLSVVREHVTGTMTLDARRYSNGDLVFVTSSVAVSGSGAYPGFVPYTGFAVGSTNTNGEFWVQETRAWSSHLLADEVDAHAQHFESYGRDESHRNDDLRVHWRLADGAYVTATGALTVLDSTPYGVNGSGTNFVPNTQPFTKFLVDYAYIPSVDWNGQKVRIFSGSTIDPQDAWHDDRFVALEFNMYDALDEDISHLMTSYQELNNVLGLPVNRYREEYEGLQQMRETYFKRLQGQLNFRVFVDMLDFFDTSFVTIVQRMLPARALFKGDELVVESHMLERPKYQYQLRPVHEGLIDISGSISVTDLYDIYCSR